MELARSSGDKLSEAHAHYASATVADSQGDGVGAVRHGRQALRQYERVGGRMLIAMATNALGWWTAQYGDPVAGRALCESAILLQDDDPEGRAAALDSLGEIAYQLDVFPDRSPTTRKLCTYGRNCTIRTKKPTHRPLSARSIWLSANLTVLELP
jgi:hypothetical protein